MGEILNDRPHKHLDAWKRSLELVKMVYEVTKTFPREEEFGLKAQLRRAVISVPSNLAEGLTRTSRKDKLHFLNIADGSLSEIDAQLEIARMLGYVEGTQFEDCETTLVCVERLVGGLRRSLSRN